MKRLVRFFTNDRLWQMVVASSLLSHSFSQHGRGIHKIKIIAQLHPILSRKPLSRYLWISNTIVISTLSVVIPMMPKSI